MINIASVSLMKRQRECIQIRIDMSGSNNISDLFSSEVVIDIWSVTRQPSILSAALVIDEGIKRKKVRVYSSGLTAKLTR